MNVLVLTKKVPFEENDGESIAINGLCRSLYNAGATIEMISFNTTKHFVDLDIVNPPDYIQSFTPIGLDNRIKPLPLLVDLMLNKSHNLSRFLTRSFENALISKLKKLRYDVIQLESLFMAPYIETIKKHSDAKIVMRSHNLEYIIWEKLAQNTKGILKSWYLKKCADLLKTAEHTYQNKYDLLVPISVVDQAIYKKSFPKLKSIAIPAGMNIPDLSKFETTPNRICFIGSLDWRPNEEGLIWFIENVWNKINTEFPNLTFHIAGRNSEDKLLKYRKHKNIIFHGEVESAKEFIVNHGVMIVPLFSGSGIRVKIIEGLAHGVPIISTKKGAEGIPYQDEANIIIANDKSAFVSKLIDLLKDSNKLTALSENGYLLAKQNFDTDSLGQKLYKQYQNMISDKL